MSTATEQIDQLIARLKDWRGQTLARVRKSILAADAEITEDWKWMGSPVWSRDGMIAVGNAHKGKVKLTFTQGASLPDPAKLFNAGLDDRRASLIDQIDLAGVDIGADHEVSLARKAGCRHDPDITQSEDADAHHLFLMSRAREGDRERRRGTLAPARPSRLP